MPLRVYNRAIRAPMQISSLLVVANCAVYAACAWASGRLQFNALTMFGWGAISNNTLITHDYWRLLAAGFLHFDLLHLLFNMMWIISFGSILERRVGATYFLMIYGAALVFGNVVTVLATPGTFVSAGASGAVSGILGALVCLQILGRPAMSPNTLISNIAINIGFNVAAASSIGWRAHLGGFIAGLIACAILDLIERLNPVRLNCKFPEFIKLNIAVALPASVWFCWTEISGPTGLSQPVVLAILAAVIIGCVKLIDLLLARKKGLALSIFTMAATNLALVCALAYALAAELASSCTTPHGWVGTAATWGYAVAQAACAQHSLFSAGLGCMAAALTVLLLTEPLKRGLEDVGFIPEGFRAARRRTVGL